MSRLVGAWLLAVQAACANAFTLAAHPHTAAQTSRAPSLTMQVKGYFGSTDVKLIERKDEDVAAFHTSETRRWDVVYDEVYVETPQEFYPGDRVEVVADIKVKDIENAKGMQGVVTNFEFDDGYESCQTCSTSRPVAVLLDR